jgi:hypothetical protein
MQKSVIEEIKELKARLESLTEQGKAEALDKASEAIGLLRELGIDNDTILKELAFRGRAKAQESREGRPPKDELCPVCHFSEQTLPMTEDRTVVRRRRSRLRPKNSKRRD